LPHFLNVRGSIPKAGAGKTATMSSQYSARFKTRMVERLLGPSGTSATALAAEVGVHQATLSRWVREAATVAAMNMQTKAKAQGAEPADHRRPEDWSAEEKLRAVIEASGLSEQGLGEWLRRKGIHDAQLREWRRSAVDGLGGKRQVGSQSKRVRELEREIRRKDRALAETAALLVLRKKVDALWGDEDASTGSKSDDEFSS
jgi:transposase